MKKGSQNGHSMVPDLFNTMFDGHHVGFELINGDVMVNATEMAKVFGKNTKDFLRNDSTKEFIEECLKRENSPFLKIEKEEDLYTTKQKSGTWMHRILALEFAAWLSPKFKLWVWSTIDEILFGHFRRIEESLKASAQRQTRLDDLVAELSHHDKFLEYLQLQSEERRAANARAKFASQQRDAYKEPAPTG